METSSTFSSVLSSLPPIPPLISPIQAPTTPGNSDVETQANSKLNPNPNARGDIIPLTSLLLPDSVQSVEEIKLDDKALVNDVVNVVGPSSPRPVEVTASEPSPEQIQTTQTTQAFQIEPPVEPATVLNLPPDFTEIFYSQCEPSKRPALVYDGHNVVYNKHVTEGTPLLLADRFRLSPDQGNLTVGEKNLAKGENTTIFGKRNQAGSGSLVTGEANTSNGINNYMIGCRNVTINGNNVIAIGLSSRTITVPQSNKNFMIFTSPIRVIGPTVMPRHHIDNTHQNPCLSGEGFVTLNPMSADILVTLSASPVDGQSILLKDISFLNMPKRDLDQRYSSHILPAKGHNIEATGRNGYQLGGGQYVQLCFIDSGKCWVVTNFYSPVVVTPTRRIIA
jgi:hypothetical protein